MKNNKGFSLVELIIVIAIMAVLIGVLAPQYLKYVEKSRVSTDKQTVAGVVEAVNTVLTDDEVYEKIGSSGSLTLTTTGITSGDTVSTAVKKIVGDIKMVSKTYTGSATITYNFHKADSTWSVTTVEEALADMLN